MKDPITLNLKTNLSCFKILHFIVVVKSNTYIILLSPQVVRLVSHTMKATQNTECHQFKPHHENKNNNEGVKKEPVPEDKQDNNNPETVNKEPGGAVHYCGCDTG